jgi:hypothetical protein
MTILPDEARTKTDGTTQQTKRSDVTDGFSTASRTTAQYADARTDGSGLPRILN